MVPTHPPQLSQQLVAVGGPSENGISNDSPGRLWQERPPEQPVRCFLTLLGGKSGGGLSRQQGRWQSRPKSSSRSPTGWRIGMELPSPTGPGPTTWSLGRVVGTSEARFSTRIRQTALLQEWFPDKSIRDFFPPTTILHMGPGGHRQWLKGINAMLDRLSYLLCITRQGAVNHLKAAVQRLPCGNPKTALERDRGWCILHLLHLSSSLT